jgi:hypothetical protein
MITLTREEAQQVLAAFCQSSQPAHGYRRNELHLTPKPHIELYSEAIELLRAKLSEPEPEPVVKLKELLEVQGRDGTWNYDPYFHGMYNGMEVMLAVLEDREPVFRGAPKKWLSKKEWQGLTDEEIKDILDCGRPDLVNIKKAEAKLREKNT